MNRIELCLASDYSIEMRNTFLAWILVHLFLSSVAIIVAFMIGLDVKTIAKWFLNVVIHGFPALKILLAKMYEVETAEKNYEMKLRLDNVR